MKIAYAGFDLFYPVLENLHQNGCEIVKIFSCKVDNVTEFNTQVSDFAKEHAIDLSYDRITKDDLNQLKNMGVDALFCAAYYYRIPITSEFAMINVHPSLLPQGRGAWPMPVYILNDMKTAGITFHKMAEDFDNGDIIMQKSFELTQSDNLETFMQKAYVLLPDMISELLSDFDNYYKNAVPQENGEYWQCPNEDDYIIDKNTTYEEADRITRAFYGFYITYDDGKTQHKLLYSQAYKGDNTFRKFKIKDGYIN